jgi:hypothetical protein
MTRLVIPKRTGGATHREARRYDLEGDRYQDRVAKYIPAEVVGGYVGLDSIVKSQQVQGVTRLPDVPPVGEAASAAPSLLAAFMNVEGIIFLICLVLAPLYVWHLARRDGITTWRVQALIATVAFALWAYAIKGNVFFKNEALDAWARAVMHVPEFHNPQWGAAALIVFSMFVALYQPKEGDV